MKQFWTKDEMDKLAEMAAQGKTNVQIAAALCRSVGSVAHKRARLFRDAEQADKLSAVTYCDDPHRPGAIAKEDELMKEVSDVIDRLNTLSDALAGTSEFMEELAEGQKVLTADHIEEAKKVKELRDDLTIACQEVGRVSDNVRDVRNKLENALADVHDLSNYMQQGRLWRLFHSFRSFKRGARK